MSGPPPDAPKGHTPDMKIKNQINLALNDIRVTLLELDQAGQCSYAELIVEKVRYQTNLAMDMILEHNEGRSIPWSDRKYRVAEEFS